MLTCSNLIDLVLPILIQILKMLVLSIVFSDLLRKLFI